MYDDTPPDPGKSTLDAAIKSLDRGWAPLPILRGSKAPTIAGWPELRFGSEHELADAFEDSNIGLILGAASQGLVDVDLDCPEALRLAPSLLPHTGMRHGRPSAPASHYWYTADRETATARYKDPVSGGMLVELRSTGAQTIIPPSLHPEGETLAWVGEWGEPKALPGPALAMRVRVLAAASLLSRYWPGSGGRHDATLALAGGMLRSGWTERNTTYFVAELGASVDPGVDRRDRELAVASTARRLEQGAETAGWRTLSDLINAPVVAQVREWLDLLDEPEKETGVVANRVDLGALVRDGVPEPEWLIPGLIYQAQIHWMQGEPASGKTLLTLALLYRYCEGGGTVLWLDEESGQIQTARRLQALGADPDVLSARFLYHARPGLSLDPADLDALFRLMAEEKPQVVVIDSVSDSLGQASLDEDANGDVTRWAKQFLEPLKFTYGASVIAIDHVTKSKDSRGKYARGAGAKKSKTDAAWKVVKVTDFGVGRMGLIRLECDKDRDGYLPPKVAFRIGGGPDNRIVVDQVDLIEHDEVKTPEDDLARRVHEFLRLNAEGQADAHTTSQVVESVTGKSAAIRDALTMLADDAAYRIRSLTRGRTTSWWFEDSGVELDFREMD